MIQGKIKQSRKVGIISVKDRGEGWMSISNRAVKEGFFEEVNKI